MNIFKLFKKKNTPLQKAFKTLQEINTLRFDDMTILEPTLEQQVDRLKVRITRLESLLKLRSEFYVNYVSGSGAAVDANPDQYTTKYFVSFPDGSERAIEQRSAHEVVTETLSKIFSKKRKANAQIRKQARR